MELGTRELVQFCSLVATLAADITVIDEGIVEFRGQIYEV
jgi:hypothetical protein